MTRIARLAAVLGLGVLVVGGGALGYGQVASARPDAPIAPHVTQRPAVADAPATGDSIFVPITPCRIVDTRAGGGIVHAGAVRSVHVRGSAGFAAQGGRSTGCAVPAAATAVVTSVTATGATGNGYLNGYPYGATAPTSNFAWFYRDRTSTTNPTFALGAAGTAFDLSIRASSGAGTQVIVDVDGYYEQQIEAVIQADGTLFSGTAQVVRATRIGVGMYSIGLATDADECATTATTYSPGVVATADAAGDGVLVLTYSGTDRADAFFNVTITC